jgi:TolA-binding protein
MTVGFLRSLDLPVRLYNRDQTFSTHTILEATAMKRITTVLATILSLAFTPLAAQDYDNGVEAYNAGDYQTALQEWRPLAEQGDASAQFVLL